MSRKKVTPADLMDDYVFVLEGGHEYKFRKITKSVGVRLDEAQTKAAEINIAEVSSDEAATVLIGLIDIQIEPLGDGESAGELLTGLWDEDDLDLTDLTALSETLREATYSRRRPISPRKTNA